MKKFLMVLSVLFFFAFSTSAFADFLPMGSDEYETPDDYVTIATSPTWINTLSHARYALWYLHDLGNTSLNGVNIVFHGISNELPFEVDNNIFSVYLMDMQTNLASPSVWANYTDNDDPYSPDWDSMGSELLGQWSDMDGLASDNDLVFFTDDEMILSWLTNGNSFAIGIDPDCVFSFTSVTVDVSAVPEPTTMLLLGSGLIGIGTLTRKKFFKR